MNKFFVSYTYESRDALMHECVYATFKEKLFKMIRDQLDEEKKVGLYHMIRCYLDMELITICPGQTAPVVMLFDIDTKNGQIKVYDKYGHDAPRIYDNHQYVGFHRFYSDLTNHEVLTIYIGDGYPMQNHLGSTLEFVHLYTKAHHGITPIHSDRKRSTSNNNPVGE